MNFFKKLLPTSVAAVIRSSGERTEKQCHDLLARQVNPKHLHIIHEAPFSKALHKSFEIGIREKRDWTMVIDADVLPRINIVDELVSRARCSPKSVFALQTEMLDKFFGGTRVGGIKLYRTALLEKAISLIPQVDVRPETFVIKNMHKQGHYVDITELVCGVHDFEQYYRDIFRKGFTHGIKHASFAKVLTPYWERMKRKDSDFEVLLAGFTKGKRHTSQLRLDKNETAKEFKQYMHSVQLEEKNGLTSTPHVEEVLAEFKEPKEYKAIKNEIDKKGRPTVPAAAK